MSAKFPRCQDCGKISVPMEEWKRLREGDKAKVCKCQLMTIEPAKVIQEEEEDIPVVSATRCRVCGKSILSGRELDSIADPEVRAEFCQGHKKKKVMEDLEVIEDDDDVPVVVRAKTKAAPPSVKISPLAEKLSEPLVFIMGAFGVMSFIYGIYIYVAAFIKLASAGAAEARMKDDFAEAGQAIGFAIVTYWSFGCMVGGATLFLLAKIARALHLGLKK